MTTLPLTMRYGEHALREPAAWFVAGPDPCDWLTTIADWNVPLEKLRFFVVPGLDASSSPIGALVVAPQAKVHSPGRAVPFGRVAQRLYLPVEARLDPPVSDDDLAALLPVDLEVCLWHPIAGLVGFEARDGVTFDRFLEFSPPDEADWGMAEPGVPINERLRSVEPQSVPSAISVLMQGRDDIGTEAEQISELPPLPDEPGTDLLSKAGAGMGAAFAKIGIWLLNLLPSSASSPTWADRLEQSLKDKLQRLMQQFDLSSARDRELRRLLSMLEADPDQGLKFAIPFGGEASHRGMGTAGSQLTRRDTDFNLGRLGGGGPADPWDVSNEMRLALSQKYRLLATREIQLKRYRRAAYIFAELVGDLVSAAGALMTGQHYREAACLYKERLNRPLDAARCLEKGGLWAEALQLFKELRQFEVAGDIARRIDQEDEAQRLYRVAVFAARGASDHREAARLLDDKLHVPLEALEELIEGWRGAAGGHCIRETFLLAGRLSLHERAAALVATLTAAEHLPVGLRVSTEQLVGVAKTYPDASIRLAAADAARIQMAGILTEERRAGATGAASWMQSCLKDLAPEDRLIVRDSQRFFNDGNLASKPKSTPPRGVPRGNRRNQIEFVRELQLPLAVVTAATSTGDAAYVAAYTDRALVIVRHEWLSAALGEQKVEWPLGAGFAGAPLALAIDPGGKWLNVIQAGVVDPPVLNVRLFQLNDFPDKAVAAASPRWLASNTLAVANGESAVFALKATGFHLDLSSYDGKDELLATRLLDIELPVRAHIPRPTIVPVPMQCQGSNVYIGMDRWLIIARANGATEVIEMPSPISGLACARPHTRTRVAVTYQTGGTIVWDDFSGIHQEPFGQSLESPVAGFAIGGFLVAASDDHCRLYSTNDGHVCFEAEIQWREARPIAILDTGGASEFAVCFADGRVMVYRIGAAVR